VHQGGIRLVGVVMNRTSGQQGGGYYYEYYGLEQKAPSRSLLNREKSSVKTNAGGREPGRDLLG
jgi:hypothetical protein